MDLPLSPIITIILNIIASFLVSKGILDTNTKNMFVMLVNNAISGLMTVGIAVYSIYKIVDLHKHKISVSLPASTPSSATTTTVKMENPTPSQTVTVSPTIPITTAPPHTA